MQRLSSQLAAALTEIGGGNFAVAAYPGLIVKDHHWRRPEHGVGGNGRYRPMISSACRDLKK